MASFHLLILAAASIALSASGATGAQSPVDLGTAGDFVILSKTGISTTGVTSIVGDIAVSPIDSTAITGFSLSVHASGEYATSPVVAGKIYASDYAAPTGSRLTTAVSDMQTAKLTSLILLIAGIALVIYGVSASNSISSNFFTGLLTDKAIWMLVGGAIAAIAGLFGTLRRSKQG